MRYPDTYKYLNISSRQFVFTLAKAVRYVQLTRGLFPG